MTLHVCVILNTVYFSALVQLPGHSMSEYMNGHAHKKIAKIVEK